MATIPNVYGANGSSIYTISDTTGGSGGGGAAGSSTWNVSSYTTGPTGTYTINVASSWPSYTTTVDNDLVVKRPGKNDLHVAKTLEALMERLAVIEPNFELMEKYPALREAYENYKVMEALLLGGDEDENEL
jgi:hypothetical protein